MGKQNGSADINRLMLMLLLMRMMVMTMLRIAFSSSRQLLDILLSQHERNAYRKDAVKGDEWGGSGFDSRSSLMDISLCKTRVTCGGGGGRPPTRRARLQLARKWPVPHASP